MRPATWTLRTRLVMAVLGLVAVALVMVNVIGIVLQHDTMLRRVDDQLEDIKSPPTAAQLITPPPSKVQPLQGMLAARIGAVTRIYVLGADGAIIMTLPSASGPGPDLKEVRIGGPYTVPGTEGASWRVRAVTTTDGYTMAFALSLGDLEQVRRSAVAIAFAVGAVVLLLLGLAANAAVRLGLRPLTRMERTAGRIADGDFGSRVAAPDSHTEAGRLGTAMNVMLDRLESEIAARTNSEARMRRFLADASHELRTPLTSVRGFAELYRRGGGDTDGLMGRIEDEAARMGVLVNDLLTLAQLDQVRPLERHPVDLLEVAADTIRDARVRVPDRPVQLSGLGDGLAPVSVMGDEARLRQVAANLVGNALTHTPHDAAITVRVGRSRGVAVLEVTDTGPGVPPEHVPRLFDRLYRVSKGRSRADGGAGLGLAIVAAIVGAHGGRVEVDTAPGRGATFRVLLPDSEAPPSPL
ncbi:sensor histidine kinase [Microtetraspora malaysiensis]|uniref:sensor histidine kinase n=1 Tax=Microtetraspora malaysiensis TaxID=161358 RepID=UPI003D9374A0